MSDFTERNLAMLLQRAYVDVSDERIEAAIARVRARSAPRRPALSLPALAAAALLAVTALWMTGRGPQPVLPVAVTSPSAPQDPAPAPAGEDPEIAELTRRLAKDPNDADALLKRATRFRALGDPSKALADVEALLKLKPETPEGWLLRAQIPIGALSVREAALDRALVLRPGWAAAHLARARLTDLLRIPWFELDRKALVFRRPKLAKIVRIESCEEAIRLEPTLAEAYVVRGALRALQGTVGAMEDVARAMELHPGHAEAHLIRARLILMAPDAKVADARKDILLAALRGAEVEPALLEQLPPEDRLQLRAGREAAAFGVRDWSVQQDRISEIRDLIGRLAASEEAVRKEVEEKLLGYGEAAVAELRRALYHEDPEVRVRSQQVADRVEGRLKVHSRVQNVLQAAAKLREIWKARSFDDLEAEAASLFEASHCQYVPKKNISDRFRLQVGGGPSITKEIAEALDKDPGVVFLHTYRPREASAFGPGSEREVEQLTTYASTAVIALPDAKGWSAYLVVLGLPLD